MAKSTGDRDSVLWMDDGVLWYILWGIFLLLLLIIAAKIFQRWQPTYPRERGVPRYPLVGSNEEWRDPNDALAMASASGDLQIFPNIDPEGQHNVRLAVDQFPVTQDLLENSNAENAAENAAENETALNILLAMAEVASLPRQIERDEANMRIRRPPVSSSVAESGVAPSSLVDDVGAGAPQHPPPEVPIPETVAADALAPDVVGILPGILPQQIEDNDKAHAAAEVEVEVAIEVLPPGMLQLISDVKLASLPQFATASMAMPAGDLESNLEERMPVDHPEAGDSAADLQAEVIIQDDVENLEVEEPHAEDMQ